ncbi:glycosyltransferase family 2 protein [Aquisphaera insulae]|uniref:glycosyltransferase family 2 protein n=1 Tax=Aquisphaera insulae TaxID=2712864 RepID=UPI0013ED1CE6|nr:glycosyltransferase family 2 protein [Aquisphaera insulae]
MSTLRFDPSGPVPPAPASRDGRDFLSVVVPARNEGPGLPRLVDEIVGALRPLRRGRSGSGVPRLRGFEILVVDDGSTDATAAILEDLAATVAELRPLILARNVGQSAATAAGFHAAGGDWVATLDADLQNDPADLAALWEALPGHDAVLGWRARRADTWSRRAISRAANAVRNAILGQSIRDTGCSMRIFRREQALRMPAFHGVHRFYGPLLIREGCRVLQVPVNHRPRAHGRSHYNFRNRSLRVVVDLLGVAWLMRRPLRYEVMGRPGRIGRAGAFVAAESMSEGG